MADLGEPDGHEQAGRRHVVVVQTDRLNHLSTTVVVPLTTQTHHVGFATTVALPVSETGLRRPSYALCLHLRVLDQRKLINRMGHVSAAKMSEIEVAVNFALGLP